MEGLGFGGGLTACWFWVSGLGSDITAIDIIRIGRWGIKGKSLLRRCRILYLGFEKRIPTFTHCFGSPSKPPGVSNGSCRTPRGSNSRKPNMYLFRAFVS